MPRVVNWNDYRTAFEAEAGRILGQPVHVGGSADASILPTPSLAFTDVKVGDVEGKPMMTVDRFEVTIELMPLLQGEIRVISMKLVRPSVAVSVDDTGTVDWLIRNEASKTLDPDKVVLENVEISDGSIAYRDARTGIDRSFPGINAQVEARSLYGPWRIAGSYLDGKRRVPFQFATGRRSDKGGIRVKSEISPVEWPVSVVADGDLQSGPDGVSYAGTYVLTEVASAPPDAAATGDQTLIAGWKSEGTFALSRDRLWVEKAVLNVGPPDRPYSLAGSLDVALGKAPSFQATVQARQLDLDRALGNGPAEPIDPKAAAAQLVAWIGDVYVPSIPGRIAFDVPGIIVGGAAIQDTRFRAEPGAAGWKIADLTVKLPGQSVLEGSGTLTTEGAIGFIGDVALTVRQPGIFAAWWRGARQGAERVLSPFRLAGTATVAEGALAVDGLEMTVGDSTITGRFAWSEARTAERRRHLGASLSADRVDFGQLQALAELLVGQDVTHTAALADSFALNVSAGSLTYGDVEARDIAVDASFADDALTVNRFRIGDLGGASVTVTQGQLANPFGTAPEGSLQAEIVAGTSLKGMAAALDAFEPARPVADWLQAAGPSLVPAGLKVQVTARPEDGQARYHVAATGAAADTSLAATLDLGGQAALWRQSPLSLSLTLDAMDAGDFVRQTGLKVPTAGVGGAVHLDLKAKGVPSAGVDGTLSGEFAGLAVETAGRLVLAAGKPADYAGTLTLKSPDLRPVIDLAGLDVPGAAMGTPVALDGKVAVKGAAVTVEAPGATIGDRLVGGAVTAVRSGAEWTLDGDIHADEVDLGWLSALRLGFAVQPTGDRFSPWSKAPFADLRAGPLAGKLRIAADRFAITDSIVATDAALAVSLGDNRLDVDLAKGAVAGGTIAGGIAVRNVGGNVSLTGHVDAKDLAVDAMTWERAGRAVATGTADVSGNFEAAGRSPAGLVASLTGGGTLSVRDGEARFVNPKSATLIIRASDLGQDFTDDTLQAAFESYIDGGSLPFARAEGPFAIAAGTLRLKDVPVAAKGADVVADATVDLNRMSLDADLRVAFATNDDRAQGAVPQLGLVFRGPLAEPARAIDAVQFGSYLNIRREERIQDILSMEQADRAEKERLNRLKRKLAEDAGRRLADFRAADAEAKSLADRVAELRARVADAARAVEQAKAVETAAQAAEADAKAARDKAVDLSASASKALDGARSENAAAAGAADRLAAALDAAKGAAAEASKARAAAVADAGDKAAASRAADAALVKATALRAAAEKTVADRAKAVAAAAEAVDAADGDRRAAEAALATAEEERAGAAAALADASEKAALVASEAERKAADAVTASSGTDEAAATAALQAAADAKAAATAAAAALDLARKRANAADRAAEDAKAKLASLTSRKSQVEAALDKASGARSDADQALAEKASAEKTVTALAGSAKAAADAAAKEAGDRAAAEEEAANGVDAAQADLAAARARLKDAAARLADATAAAGKASAEADRLVAVAADAIATAESAAAARVAAEGAAASAAKDLADAEEGAKAAAARAEALKPADLAMAAPAEDGAPASISPAAADGSLAPLTTGGVRAPAPKARAASRPKNAPIDLLPLRAQ